MLDFTSALYLGFDHASCTLEGWRQLTLGKPGALEEPPGISQVEQSLAALVGCERVLLGPSTLHLFCDLFALLAEPHAAILIDACAYPIARWGTDRAAALGIPVRTFAGHASGSLRRELSITRGMKPILVTDGYCPACGITPPLVEYADCAAAGGGLLIVDDTQALGVLGQPSASPYGSGGGGSLRRLNLSHPAVVVVSSLAKAFGVPVAMLGGTAAFVESFRDHSATRVHCSPPSAAVIQAAMSALEQNRRFGDALRWRLAERVVHFRTGLKRLELLATRSLFPMQPLKPPPRVGARRLHQTLFDKGIRSVLHKVADDGAVRISFLLTARHPLIEIDRAIRSLTEALTFRS